MTVGSLLKRSLGIEKLKNVMITKMLVSDIQNIYIVLYDSHNDKTIGEMMLKKIPFVSMLYSAEDLLGIGMQIPSYRPLLPIDKFDTQINRAKVMVVDLSYQQALNKKDFVKLPESLAIKEAFTVGDLLSNAVSNKTKHWYNDRKGNSKSNSKLTHATWNHKKDEILINFHTIPTYDKKVQVTSKNAKLQDANTYKTIIQLVGVNKHLGTKKEFKLFTMAERTELVKLAVANAELRIWANDPSFLFQGAWEGLDQLDGSVYPFTGVSGKGIWDRRHAQSGGLQIASVHITKHTYEVLLQLTKLSSQIGRKLFKKYGS